MAEDGDEKMPMLGDAADSPAVTPSEEIQKPVTTQQQEAPSDEEEPVHTEKVTDLDSKSVDEPSVDDVQLQSPDTDSTEQPPTNDTDNPPVQETRPAQLDLSAGDTSTLNGGSNVSRESGTALPLPSTPTTPSSPSGGDKPVKPPRLKSMRSKESPPLLHTKPVDRDVESSVPEEADDSALMAATTDSQMEMKLLESNPYNSTTAPQVAAVQPKKKFGLDYIMNNKWIVLGIVAIILLVLIILIVGVTVSRKAPPKPLQPEVSPAPVVNGLKCGEMMGVWEINNTVAIFKGIPYSLPPTADNRWKYDLPINDVAQCSNDSNAKQFRGPCFQLNPVLGDEENYIGSEDCLYLNVWTPNFPADSSAISDEDTLPVLVYIHGGFLHFGSGHDNLFSPSAELAHEMNAVIVSFNYRLNVFGWLAVENLVGEGLPAAGNFGLRDQMNALKWVKEYIRQFGGNPEQVTLAGLSSGGTSVLALMANSEARTYFSKAWISGASSKFDGDKEDTYTANTNTIVKTVGCGEADNVRTCLLNKTAEQLADSIPWIQYPSWEATELLQPPEKDTFIGGVLVNDGVYVTESPAVTLEKSQDIDIPLLIGNGEYETDMYQVVPNLEQWNWARYSDYLRSKLDTFTEKDYSDAALDYEYAMNLKDNPRLHMAKIVSDMRSICPQTFLAESITKGNKAHVYRYVMTDPVPQSLADKYQSGSTVATHGTDFAKLFHYSDTDTEAYSKSKSRFRQLIRNFMVSGIMETWAPSPAAYNISANSEANVSLKQWIPDGSCQMWKDLYPLYSWMN